MSGASGHSDGWIRAGSLPITTTHKGKTGRRQYTPAGIVAEHRTKSSFTCTSFDWPQVNINSCPCHIREIVLFLFCSDTIADFIALNFISSVLKHSIEHHFPHLLL